MSKAMNLSEVLAEMIKELDLVSVVRCKDCKFYVPEDGRCDVIEQFDLPEMFFCGNGVRGDSECSK